MKNTVSSLFALFVVAALAAADGVSVATVNLALLVRNHPTTEKNKTELNALKENYEAQRDGKIAALKEMRNEIDGLMEKAQNETYSDVQRTAFRATARSKVAELQNAEAELRKFVDELQDKLTDAERERLGVTLDDIRLHLQAVVKERGIDLVVDSSRNPIGGASSVLYAAAAIDITDVLDERIQTAYKDSAATANAPAAAPKE